MASLSIINKIKGSAFLYNVYYYAGTFFVNFMKVFTKPDEKLLLFVSYGGRKYDDTPKDIYEAMLKDHRFDSFHLVWAFLDPDKYEVGRGGKIKIDTIKYFRTALKARAWITNVSVTRGLRFRGIHTFSINSWHGTAIKLIGDDAINECTFNTKDNGRLADIMLAQGHHDVYVYSRAFKMPQEDVVITGFPRNDTLVTDNMPENIIKLKQEMGLPLDKRVILYAPTFRDFERENGYNCILKPPFDLEKWQKTFEKDYILIVRAHLAVSKVMGVKENSFVRNFSQYPKLNDVLLVTDILISDYSGILFDFSILGRPIYCYAYDYDKYKKMRGMYIDIRKDLESYADEDSLMKAIAEMDESKMAQRVLQFRNKYVEKFGSSAKRVADLVYDAIQ